MLRTLLYLLPLTTFCSCVIVTLQNQDQHGAAAVAERPHIYNCRSPNMEDFSCWWLPLGDLTPGQQVSYVLTYSIEKGPSLECPDYASSGPNSCHFDKSHTSVWKIYCMNVTAVTAQRNYSSPQHCVDVADIVQTEAPVNLTFTLADADGDETGHKINLSWQYPVPSHLQYGWITLVYQLQYRRLTQPDNWKVKYPLNEPHVQLLGLPVGEYVVRVRCRSQNYGLWSNWSSSLQMNIPPKTPTGKLLVLVLVTSAGIVTLLVVVLGLVPQRKKIKDFLLPQIPMPRIMGIDPLLLKKGHLDEINRHLSNFHSYRPPSYTEEAWEQISTDSMFMSTSKDPDTKDKEKTPFIVQCELKPTSAGLPTPAQTLPWYIQSLSPYCSTPPDAFAPTRDISLLKLELTSLLDNNTVVPGGALTPHAVALDNQLTPPNFYTCVQLVNEHRQLHLVPRTAMTPYCSEFPPLPSNQPDASKTQEQEEKKMAEYLSCRNFKDRGEDQRNEAAIPLLE